MTSARPSSAPDGIDAPHGRAGHAAIGVDRDVAISRLAGGVAHDFNNLLMVISGHAELLAEALPPDHPGRADADAIRSAVEVAARTTGHLLAISERQVLVPVRTDVNDVAMDVVAQLSAHVRTRTTIALELGHGVPAVTVDRTQLTRAVADLVAHAADATPVGGTVRLATHATGSTAAIVVADGGAGLTEQAHGLLFDPYAVSAPWGARSGLALAAARGMVQQSGGRLTAVSQPGRGCVLTLTLPAVRDAESVAGRSESTTSDTGRTPRALPI